MKSSVYVAFLRGINVGGKTLIKMEDLKKAFESLGFTNVRTILASGNVVFETSERSVSILAQKIEEKLAKAFRLQPRVLLRASGEILSLIESKPFKAVKVTPNTRLQVTFLTENEGNHSEFPYELPNDDFKITRVSEGEVCSVVGLVPGKGTSELMQILQKEFGKAQTTRNWNTIEKIAALFPG